MLAVSLLSSVGVTLAWLYFFVRRDRHPEPLWLLARTFAWGMFAWLVAAAFGVSLQRISLGNATLTLLVLALLTAILEESSKFLAASTVVNERDFDEPMDGLVYAVTAALGFALMENITYALGFGPRAATWHALITTLAHALFSAPQGYALGGRHWQIGRWWAARGLLLSIALHFLFNSLLSDNGSPYTWPQLLALGGVVVLMVFLARRYYLNFEAHARIHGNTLNPQRPKAD
ncbi:PrsW family intramembrane metalloprotease [Deinococcus sp. QL22]|uniref:PrsW family intramembrane metalloprotease n=1 Tax=Deinococcus sp. QL22 TaxID=2939437 RepID=UPI002017A778|nr:PrsW family glutamic-type intramembrane protease [Deinococcus sp. QL22]UQN07681.1 PrsW family glutamic-type intramembrane protease [Deinococcus sp. QL22]